jgi:uncharacterized membrane protein
MSTSPEVARSTTGLDPNVAAVLAYAFGWLSGLALWLIERESRYVRFHAIQSTLFFGALALLSLIFAKVIPAASFVGGFVIWPLFFVLWIVFMFKAWKGERFMIPVIGPWADERAQLP